MSAEVRWGILAPGGIAHKFAQNLRDVPRMSITAVGSRDPERARLFADEYSIPAAHGSYEDLVSDPAVDIVYITSPHSLHFRHAILALGQNKAVLVEKPFAMNLGEAEALIAEARRRGLLLMDGLWTLCNPLFIEIARRIRSGEIGEPRAFSANLGPMGFPLARGSGTRLENPELGASILLECHIYAVAVMLSLMPGMRDAEVLAASALWSDQHIDEHCSVLLKSADGGTASITGGVTFDTNGSSTSRATVMGSSGWLEIDDDLFNARKATIATGRPQPEILESEAGSKGLAWEIEEAGRAFLVGEVESPFVPHALSLDIMRIMDKIRVAAGSSK